MQGIHTHDCYCDYDMTLVKPEWLDLPILRHLTFGYLRHHLVAIFDTIPQHITLSLVRIVENAQTHWNERIHQLNSMKNVCFPSSPRDYHINHSEEGEMDLWEEQNLVGYMKIFFDPVTQERSGVFVNETLADLLGIDREILLSQFQDHSFKFPLLDLDFVFILIDDINQVLQNRTDR